MASLDERRAGFKRYKEDVQRRGKPFFPSAMFHDTVMSLVVVCVIIALAVIWKYTTPSRRALHRQGRSGDDELRPAARLVLLLPLLPAADLQVAGVGDPRHDRHPDDLPRAAARAAVRRPADGAAAVAPPSRDRRARCSSSSRWASSRTRARRRRRRSGARCSARCRIGPRNRASRTTRSPWRARSCSRSPCTTCHTYLGAGSSNHGAPDLSAIGASGQGVAFFERYVSDPSQFGNTIMPQFGEQLSKEQIHQIAVFLDASKGAK